MVRQTGDPQSSWEQWAEREMHTAELMLTAYCSERIQSKGGKGQVRGKVQWEAGQRRQLRGQGVIRAPASSKDCRDKPEFRAATFPEKRELQRGDPNIRQSS